jgi:hypothetical protein
MGIYNYYEIMTIDLFLKHVFFINQRSITKMAINDANNKAATQEQPRATRSAPTQDAPKQDSSMAPLNLFTGGNTRFAPIGKGVGSEYLNKLAISLGELYKAVDQNTEMSLISIDNANETMLAFSAIVVCMRNRNNLKLGVAYHILLIEATGDKITPLFENYPNRQPVEVIRTTSMAIDQVLEQLVVAKVQAAYPNTAMHYVDACVVPRGFNPEDKRQVHQLALNAGLALGTELATAVPGFEDLNLATIGHDNSLAINVGFSRTTLENLVGEPMRSDVIINFAAQQNNQTQSRSVNGGDRTSKISEVSGYVDFVWAPLQNTQYNPFMPQAVIQPQKYAARMVITNLATNFAATPASILLAVYTSLAVRDNNNWIQTLTPNAIAGAPMDMSDIGKMNYEANTENNPSGVGAYVDTKTASFTLDTLATYCSTIIQNGLVISIDVPEAGPQSWYLSVFNAASMGSQQAIDIILNAANSLTNGNFAKYFQPGSQIFAGPSDPVHLGTYLDKNGAKRDLRDIDYLSVINLTGDKELNTIRSWGDTFVRTDFPSMLRLSERKRIIMGLTRDSAEITGFANRVTFTSAFLDALASGCRDTNISVRINTPMNADDFNSQRAVAGFVGAGLMAPTQSFTQYQTGFNNQPVTFNNIGGRF